MRVLAAQETSGRRASTARPSRRRATRLMSPAAGSARRGTGGGVARELVTAHLEDQVGRNLELVVVLAGADRVAVVVVAPDARTGRDPHRHPFAGDPEAQLLVDVLAEADA